MIPAGDWRGTLKGGIPRLAKWMMQNDWQTNGGIDTYIYQLGV